MKCKSGHAIYAKTPMRPLSGLGDLGFSIHYGREDIANTQIKDFALGC